MGNSPASRFVQATTPYTLVDGTEVAENYAALVNANSVALLHPIDEDETGGFANATVFTGTNTDGTPSPDNCADWVSASSSASGDYGATNRVDFGWTADGSNPCSDDAFALICVEQPHLIFVATTSPQTGDIGTGGVAGADDICAGAANSANLSGTFRAWLSDNDGNSPSTKFTEYPGPYALVDGTLIADSYVALVSGSLQNPIDEDAYGDLVASHSSVWTGTGSDGTSAGTLTCNGWTSAADGLRGAIGFTDQTGSGWTAAAEQACSDTSYLYCVQQ